jgi:hypothetical protein
MINNNKLNFKTRYSSGRNVNYLVQLVNKISELTFQIWTCDTPAAEMGSTIQCLNHFYGGKKAEFMLLYSHNLLCTVHVYDQFN